jgi:hypothetical protein
MLGPHGELLPLPVSALAGSPFADYFVPGAILFFVIGLGPLVGAALSWRRHPLAPILATVVGCGLLTWMAVETVFAMTSSNSAGVTGRLACPATDQVGEGTRTVSTQRSVRLVRADEGRSFYGPRRIEQNKSVPLNTK